MGGAKQTKTASREKMQGREQESLMGEGLGEDGTRGAVVSPQEEELGLGGMGGRTPSSLRPQEGGFA